MGFEILNSPWTAHAGTVRGPYGPRMAKYVARAGFLSILVVCAVRHPCGSRMGPHTGPVGYEKHWRLPCGHGPVLCLYGHRTTRGVLRIIRPNHKCTAVSSRMEPVAWCDHENSTNVKFLRALHSAIRARNRTGDKNHMGSVVGCDWGISRRLGFHS